MSVEVRRRESADIQVVADVLSAQQAEAQYPFVWDAARPMTEFVARDREIAAFVASVDGEVVGHASAVMPRFGSPDMDPLGEAWSAAHSCGLDELAVVSAVFASVRHRRMGIGSALLAAVVGAIHDAGCHACLDTVTPVHDASIALYQRAGWQLVAEGLHPSWLPSEVSQVAMILPTPPSAHKL